MTDLQALYAGICALPDEDTPRLALADFLDELGGKENTFRADFIRTHCQLSREEPWSPAWRSLNDKWEKLHSRAIDLATKHKLPWVLHLKTRVRAFYFERGLVGELTLFSKRFVNEGAAYFEQDPIRGVKFVKLNSNMGAVAPAVLFACPHLARLAKLDLEGSGLNDSQVSILAASPHLNGLRRLGFGGEHTFGAAAIPKVLQALPAVSELSFNYNWRFGDGHLSSLARYPELARVSVLDLTSTAASAKGITALLASKHTTGLTVLRFGSVMGMDEEYGYLATPNVTVKDGQAVAQAVAAANLPKLQELELGYRGINDAGVKVIAGAAAKLPALRRLRLDNCKLTAAGLTALAESELGPRLLHLDISFNPKLKIEKKKRKGLKEMFPAAAIEETLDYVD